MKGEVETDTDVGGKVVTRDRREKGGLCLGQVRLLSPKGLRDSLVVQGKQRSRLDCCAKEIKVKLSLLRETRLFCSKCVWSADRGAVIRLHHCYYNISELHG